MFVLASYSLCKVSAYCGSSAAVYGDTCSSCILWFCEGALYQNTLNDSSS